MCGQTAAWVGVCSNSRVGTTKKPEGPFFGYCHDDCDCCRDGREQTRLCQPFRSEHVWDMYARSSSDLSLSDKVGMQTRRRLLTSGASNEITPQQRLDDQRRKLESSSLCGSCSHDSLQTVLALPSLHVRSMGSLVNSTHSLKTGRPTLNAQHSP